MTGYSYLPLQSFQRLEEAADWVEILEANQIEYHWQESFSGLEDGTVVGPVRRFFALTVKENELAKARNLLKPVAQEWVLRYDESHFLYLYSQQELYEILERPDQWSLEEVEMSRRILRERGFCLTEEEEEWLYQSRLEEVRQTQKRAETSWIVGLYLFSLIGGYFSIMLAWMFASSKQLDPSGEKFYTYDRWTRKHAKNIMILSLAGIGTWFVHLYVIYQGI